MKTIQYQRGTKIAKPGIYAGIPMEVYHGDLAVGPSVSSTGLRTLFTASPAHFFVDSYLNPAQEDQTDSEALTLGRAAHHLLLGEEAFSTQFIVRPEQFDSWRTKASKEWRAEQEADGRTVLVSSQIETIRAMAHALANHPLIQAGILNGDIERSMVWQDRATGVWLKARPDAIPNDSGDFADLKTTCNYGWDLDRDISKMRYDMQAALVGMGYRELTGREMTSFNFVFIGKAPPYCIEVLELDKQDIERAEADLRTAIETFAWCIAHKTWFGPAGTQNDARFVHISDYAKTDAEARRYFLHREITRNAIPEDTAKYACVP